MFKLMFENRCIVPDRAKLKNAENQRFSTFCGGSSDFLVIRLELRSIAVTRWYSEYCNAILSVVHELHTALFQCSSPSFHWVSTKVYKKIIF